MTTPIRRAPGAGTQAVIDRPKKAAAAEVRYPKLNALIDASRSRLYLHLVDLHDPDVMAHLKAAAKRGVDVHVVVTPKKEMPVAERLNLQELEGAGVDVVVKGKTGLESKMGLIDGKAFATRQGSTPTTTTDAAAIAKNERLFSEALKTNAVLAHKGLLPPGKLIFHPMPESTAAPILNVINSAKKTIDLEVYQLTEPSVIEALKNAAARGVKVRVMLEPKTVEKGNFDSLAPKLRAAGIDVKTTPEKFDSHHNVDHAKFLIADGAEVMIGTGNLVRSGLGGNEKPEANNRDFWVETSRPKELNDAIKLFDADWNRKDTKASDFETLVVTPDNDETKIFDLIDAAKDKLYVYNQSLSDDETIAKLLEAKARGVDVKVLLGVQGKPGETPKNEAAKKRLEAAGIEVKYYSAHYLHAKGIVSDTDMFLGSQNFTNGGMENNRELGAIVTDDKLAAAMAKIFLNDFANPV